MRTRNRILMMTALGLLSGLAPGLAFEGKAPPPVEVTPAQVTPAVQLGISRAVQPYVPRPPGSIPRSGYTPAAAIPNAALPRPTAPVPALAAPATPITPFEAFRSGARALRDGHKEKALVSLEYAAEQGLIAAQWKLGRMYAEGDGVERSNMRAFEYFSGIADAHADDNPGTPQSRYVANAFVALGHYYREGIANSDVKTDLGRARHMYAYAASYFADPDAQYHLARMMLDVTGPTRDTKQAARWLHSAANKAQYQAQAVLGRMLFRGEPGVPRQAARGLMWLTLARSNAGPSEGWVTELYDGAVKQATDDERALAGDFLTRWMNGKRD